MRTLTRLVVSLVALVGVSPSVQAQFDDGALLVQCQKTVTPLAAQFERSRRAALGHCARKALQCPDVLTSSTTASSDACLAALATKCQAAIDAQA